MRICGGPILLCFSDGGLLWGADYRAPVLHCAFKANIVSTSSSALEPLSDFILPLLEKEVGLQEPSLCSVLRHLHTRPLYKRNGDESIVLVRRDSLLPGGRLTSLLDGKG